MWPFRKLRGISIDNREIELAGFTAKRDAIKGILDRSQNINNRIIEEYASLALIVARSEKALELARRNSGVGSAP